MKKIYLLSAILATTLSFGQQSLPFTDTFSHAAGNLHETSPWSALGTPNASDHILLDGSKVTFDGLGTDAQVIIASQTTGTIYYKFTINVLSMAGVTDVNGGYLAGFSQNTTTFGGTLWTKRIDDSSFNLGIETRTATAAGTTWAPGTYTTGTNYTVVVAYTFGAGASDDTTKLWVNPTAGDEATPLITDTHTGTDLSSIVSFFLRQDSVTETPSVEVDNLKVSTTFADVLSNSRFDAIAGLKIYPNPVVDGKLFISTDLNTAKTVSIYDILGKQVLNTRISNEVINVTSLKTGVYVVKITEEGKTATRKLVIK